MAGVRADALSDPEVGLGQVGGQPPPVGEGVPYPVFGLTSLLEHASAKLPGGSEATYATTDASAAGVRGQRIVKPPLPGIAIVSNGDR